MTSPALRIEALPPGTSHDSNTMRTLTDLVNEVYATAEHGLWLPGTTRTNVDEMTLACGPDNRAVDDGGWQTTINTRGECEWTPPPDLDHGQSRINYYHRPEALLRPPQDPEDPEDKAAPDTPGGPEPPNDQAA